ncbi:short-chain dehydrogenase [Dictyobacter alpinus]|uniref:Short-chain dehydrogenase n=1 Tax=Dictyobacter alpinus TaxID=2014873 RepID=A0A402BJZ5_9CHLR|nr:SDR family NAD(P)-dependent oxidoreductase [Dictyobacter alpinus]GCE31677.1 short-chain dehydrogenase [Dictyobacter alpinus]
MPSVLSFEQHYGPWALVTGAASGLGKECTNQLAARGLHIVAVDVNAEKLQKQVLFLQQTYHIQARTLVLDLSTPDFLSEVQQATSDLEIGLLANIAGLSSVGPLLDVELATLQRQIMINCLAPLNLSYHFGRLMRTRGHGGIIFFSSASALQGTALVTNYAATKAYNLILAEGLWDELRGAGIDVLGFAPGATNTPGFHHAQPHYKAIPMPYMEPGPTITEAINALGKTPSKIAGRSNRAAAFLTTRILSRKQAIKMFGDNMRKLYPQHAQPITKSQKHS